MNDLVKKEHWNDPDIEVFSLEKWQKMIETGLMPDGMSAQQASLISCKGREMGLKPMRAIQCLVVIKGRVTMSGEGMAALIRERVKYYKQRVIERSHERACIEVSRGAKIDGEVFWEDYQRIEFTIENAKRAQLLNKTVWKQYPEDMLWWRCISRMARVIFPDIIQGVYIPDEALSASVEPEIVSAGKPKNLSELKKQLQLKESEEVTELEYTPDPSLDIDYGEIEQGEEVGESNEQPQGDTSS